MYHGPAMKITAGVIGTVLVVSLAACSSESSSAEEKTIRLTTSYVDAWQKPLEAAAAAYEKANPGITVEIGGIPYEGYQATLQTQLVGGAAADILLVEPPAAADFASKGYLYALDSDLEEDDWGGQFKDGLLDATTAADGSHYLAPWSSVAVLLAYHQELYDEAGVTDAPVDWDTWIDINEQLKTAGQSPLYVSLKGDDATTWWILVNKLNAMLRPLTEQINLISADGWAFDPLDLSSNIGESYTTDELYVAFEKGLIDPAESDAYQRAVELTAELIPFLNDNTGSVTPTDLQAEFNTSKTPQLISVGQTLVAIVTSMADAGAEYDVQTVDLPSITEDNWSGLTAGGENPLAGPRNGFVVNGASENLPEAVDFLKFITSSEQATAMYAEQPQGDPSAVNDVTYSEDSAIQSDSTAKFAEINAYGFGGAPTFDTQDFDEFNAQWQKFLTGNSSIDEFLQERSASNRGALERNLQLNAASIDQDFIDAELGK